jgi:hypothetical protein
VTGSASRRRLAYALAAASFLAAAVIWTVFIHPLDTHALVGFNQTDYLALAVLLVPVAAVAVGVAYRMPWPTWTLLVAAIAAPAVLGAIAHANADELRWQRDAARRL